MATCGLASLTWPAVVAIALGVSGFVVSVGLFLKFLTEVEV